MADYVKNIESQIRAGQLGPDIDPEAIFGQLRNMIGSQFTSGAGYLSGASRKAGFTSPSLASRISAITQSGARQAGVGMAGSINEFQRQRYQDAVSRYFQLRGLDMAEEQGESNLWGGLVGGAAGLLTNALGFKYLSKNIPTGT